MAKGVLCITRYPGQRIMVGDNIVIRINNVKGNRVQVGVNAPDHKISRPTNEEDRLDREEARRVIAPVHLPEIRRGR